MGFAHQSLADEKVARIGIDGKPRNTANEIISRCDCSKEVEQPKHHKREIDRILKEMEKVDNKPVKIKTKPSLRNRVWVEDSNVVGVWYWGWYNYNDNKFHYTRRETRNALSNLISVVPNYKKYNKRTTSWPVVYDP